MDELTGHRTTGENRVLLSSVATQTQTSDQNTLAPHIVDNLAQQPLWHSLYFTWTEISAKFIRDNKHTYFICSIYGLYIFGPY